MESVLNFVQQMSPLQKLTWIVICLSAHWFIEGWAPLFKHEYSKWRHARTNLSLLGYTIAINLLFGLATLGVFRWAGANNIGLLYYVNLPLWAELLIAFMILDLIGQYGVHYFLHKIKWMWRFHMVHHSDTHVDATTGTRHHPGDYFIRECFALVAIVLVGAPLAFYLFYRVTTVFFAYFSHANMNMPLWLDKALSYVIITPNMHKFHHHVERPWTDSNYGNIFSIWDRIFGTFVYDDPKKVKYGLDVLEGRPDEDLLYQLKVPFDKTVKTDT